MAFGVEDAAELDHAALVDAAETFEPADPAVHAPAGEVVGGVGGAGASEGGEGGGLGADDELGDEALDEARGLLGGCFGYAGVVGVLD